MRRRRSSSAVSTSAWASVNLALFARARSPARSVACRDAPDKSVAARIDLISLMVQLREIHALCTSDVQVATSYPRAFSGEQRGGSNVVTAKAQRRDLCDVAAKGCETGCVCSARVPLSRLNTARP